MTTIHIASESAPPSSPALAQALVGVFSRSAAMGVLTGPTVTQLDGAAVRQLLNDLQRHDIGGAAAVALAPLLDDAGTALGTRDGAALVYRLDQVAEALEASATPSTEWPALREVFGDELLGALLGVSMSSLRRYGAAERDTPAGVVDRLHWLAMVVADLNGGYNNYGIRRWFERPRSQLSGQSPRTLLGSQWHVDDEAALRVRKLAGALTGAMPLAV